MDMKKRGRRTGAFEVVTVTAATVTVLFIFLAMAGIVIKGIPSLPEIRDSEEVRFAMKLSLWTSLVSTMICLLLGVPTAYAVTRPSFRLRRLYEVIVEIPLSVPNIMLGLSLMILFASAPGKFLSAHGFRVIFHVNGIVTAHLFVNLPFVIHMIKTTFMDMDPHLELVAGSLGAPPWKRFCLVTLPLARNAIIGAGILAWSRALGEFGATLMLVGATRMKTETLPTSIFLNMSTGDTGEALACAVILLAISGVSQLAAGLLTRSNAGRGTGVHI